MPSFMAFISADAVPSYNFKITLPTNASQTITSTLPNGMSLASTEPTKLISLHSFKSGKVSLTRAFPFSSSAPILTIPTVGFLTPIISLLYMVPIFAYCTSCEGLESTFAPQSISRENPFNVGNIGTRGLLSTPLARPTMV